ncbi:Hypothetical_protein [Hexamita inflata]|uniref:Hypothetical_protein n=1 Tax=Hexamita inflata TaxID=28002 RepID=A0AA86NXV7_9EUKA|nr:Hypothetical protein HINF_LOCUS16302 [Hexamita inflata]
MERNSTIRGLSPITTSRKKRQSTLLSVFGLIPSDFHLFFVVLQKSAIELLLTDVFQNLFQPKINKIKIFVHSVLPYLVFYLIFYQVQYSLIIMIQTRSSFY